MLKGGEDEDEVATKLQAAFKAMQVGFLLMLIVIVSMFIVHTHAGTCADDPADGEVMPMGKVIPMVKVMPMVKVESCANGALIGARGAG